MKPQVTCKPTRRNCSRGVVILFVTILAIGCASTDPKLRIHCFRDNMTTSMMHAARQAGVELLGSDIAISTRGGYVIANALLVPPPGVPLEEAKKISLLYLSYPLSDPCSAVIAPGFYTFERVSEPFGYNQQAKLVNLDGHTVWKMPLNVKTTTVAPESGKEPMVFAEATIVQAETDMSLTMMAAHETICYPKDGTWYWIWGNPPGD